MLPYQSVSLGKSSPVLAASDTLILLFPKYWQLGETKPALCFLNINAFLRKLASGFCFVLLLQLPFIYITLLAARHSDLQVLTDSRLRGSWWETQYFGANVRNRDPERSSVAKRKNRKKKKKQRQQKQIACSLHYGLASLCTSSTHN